MQISVDGVTDVAGLIRHIRNQAGMTQQQLAELARTTQSAVSRWEHGQDEPRISTLAALMSACGHSLELRTEPDGIDRAQIRQQLAMTSDERLASVVNLSRTLAAATPAR